MANAVLDYLNPLHSTIETTDSSFDKSFHKEFRQKMANVFFFFAGAHDLNTIRLDTRGKAHLGVFDYLTLGIFRVIDLLMLFSVVMVYFSIFPNDGARIKDSIIARIIFVVLGSVFAALLALPALISLTLRYSAATLFAAATSPFVLIEHGIKSLWQILNGLKFRKLNPADVTGTAILNHFNPLHSTIETTDSPLAGIYRKGFSQKLADTFFFFAGVQNINILLKGGGKVHVGAFDYLTLGIFRVIDFFTLASLFVVYSSIFPNEEAAKGSKPVRISLGILASLFAAILALPSLISFTLRYSTAFIFTVAAFVPVLIVHGLTTLWSRSYFQDLNGLEGSEAHVNANSSSYSSSGTSTFGARFAQAALNDIEVSVKSDSLLITLKPQNEATLDWRKGLIINLASESNGKQNKALEALFALNIGHLSENEENEKNRWEAGVNVDENGWGTATKIKKVPPQNHRYAFFNYHFKVLASGQTQQVKDDDNYLKLANKYGRQKCG